MITPTTKQQSSPGRSTPPDHEATLITSLHDAMLENGISIDVADVANFIVALKSKPLAVLAGPAFTGKEALVQCLAQMFNEQERFHIQFITGHPWWAAGSTHIASHTGLHARFMTEKIIAVMEEAGQPNHTHQVFVACLVRMSPAELLSFFTEVAFQIQHGQIMRIGDIHTA